MGCLNHFAVDSERRPPLWKSRMTHSLLLLTLTDDSIFWISLLLLHIISHTLPLHQFDHFGVCMMVPSFLVHLLIPFSNLRSNPSPNPPPFTSKPTPDSVFKTSEGLPLTGRFESRALELLSLAVRHHYWTLDPSQFLNYLHNPPAHLQVPPRPYLLSFSEIPLPNTPSWNLWS